MKTTVLIYCADSGPGGKSLANHLRNGETRVFLHSASGFTGVADPRCDRVYVMPDVPGWRREMIEKAYGERSMHNEKTDESTVDRFNNQVNFLGFVPMKSAHEFGTVEMPLVAGNARVDGPYVQIEEDGSLTPITGETREVTVNTVDPDKDYAVVADPLPRRRGRPPKQRS